jgi:hypothetical protein
MPSKKYGVLHLLFRSLVKNTYIVEIEMEPNLVHPNIPTTNVLRVSGRKPIYSISVSNIFRGISLPPTPNWGRFDHYAHVNFYCISNYTAFHTLYMLKYVNR